MIITNVFFAVALLVALPVCAQTTNDIGWVSFYTREIVDVPTWEPVGHYTNDFGERFTVRRLRYWSQQEREVTHELDPLLKVWEPLTETVTNRWTDSYRFDPLFSGEPRGAIPITTNTVVGPPSTALKAQALDAAPPLMKVKLTNEFILVINTNGYSPSQVKAAIQFYERREARLTNQPPFPK